jgi:hypothetical protein
MTYDLTAVAPRAQLVAGSKGKARVHQIAIEIVDTQSSAAGPHGTMISVR